MAKSSPEDEMHQYGLVRSGRAYVKCNCTGCNPAAKPRRKHRPSDQPKEENWSRV